MKGLQWVLGIIAALSLVMGVILKLVYGFAGRYVLRATPSAFLRFAMVCILASIALSLIEIAYKREGVQK